MKNIFLLCIFVFLLSACKFQLFSKNQDYEFDKKITCWKLANDFKANWKDENTSFDEIFYSPTLNTCIIQYTCIDYNSNTEMLQELGNLTCKWFIDLADNSELGSIRYYSTFWYEDPGFLPKICNKNFSEKKDRIIQTINLSAPWKNEVLQKIYSWEKQYENCIEYLRGSNKYIDIRLEAWADEEFVPKNLDPPIRYDMNVHL